MSNRAMATNRANMNQFLIGSLANQAYFFRQQFNNHNFIIVPRRLLLCFLKTCHFCY